MSDKKITVNGYEQLIPMEDYKQYFLFADVDNNRFADVDIYEVSPYSKETIYYGMEVLARMFRYRHGDDDNNGVMIGRGEDESIDFLIEFIDKYIKDPLRLIVDRLELDPSFKSLYRTADNKEPLGAWTYHNMLKEMHKDLPKLVGGYIDATNIYLEGGYNLSRTDIKDQLKRLGDAKDKVKFLEDSITTPIKIVCSGSLANDVPLAFYQYLQYQCVYKGMLPGSIVFYKKNTGRGCDCTKIYTYVLTSPDFYNMEFFKSIVIDNIEDMFEEFYALENVRRWEVVK